MSGTSTGGGNGTVVVAGPHVLQEEDFFVRAGILHPMTVGAIAVIALFTYLRLGSNRSIAPITTFDWLINVALGSTLAGIVNGNSLVRGLIALLTMLAFQFLTSTLSARAGNRFTRILQAPPLVIAFRGTMLAKVMRRHRISVGDLHASLRLSKVLNISQVECAIIEPNGTISVFTKKEVKDAGVEPEVLMSIPAYKALCEAEDEKEGSDEKTSEEAAKSGDEATARMDDTAGEKC